MRQRGLLVVRAATWATNPRITEDDCRRVAGDEVTFETEFAVRRFGFAGEGFLSASALAACRRSEAPRGPRHGGSYVIGVDLGGTRDDTAMVVVSVRDDEVSPGHAPVRSVVIEHAESRKNTKTNPTIVEVYAAHLAAQSRRWNGASILFDVFAAPQLAHELTKLGFRESAEPRDLPWGQRFMQVSVSATEQTLRWTKLRRLVDGGRLIIPEAFDFLTTQLHGLVATSLASGALRVEGKGSSPDHLPDALNNCMVVLEHLPPTGGSGAVERIIDAVGFSPGTGLDVRTRWVRREGARQVPASPPEWSGDEWLQYVADAMISGDVTPQVIAWVERQTGRPFKAGLSPFEVEGLRDFLDMQAALSVPIRHG